MRVCSLQPCRTLCDPMDCSLSDSSVHGILQARILAWVAILSSRGSPWPRDLTQVSCVSSLADGFFATEPLGKPKWEGRGWGEEVLLPIYSHEKCFTEIELGVKDRRGRETTFWTQTSTLPIVKNCHHFLMALYSNHAHHTIFCYYIISKFCPNVMKNVFEIFWSPMKRLFKKSCHISFPGKF